MYPPAFQSQNYTLSTAINVTFLYYMLYHKLIRKKEDAIIVEIIL